MLSKMSYLFKLKIRKVKPFMTGDDSVTEAMRMTAHGTGPPEKSANSVQDPLLFLTTAAL